MYSRFTEAELKQLKQPIYNLSQQPVKKQPIKQLTEREIWHINFKKKQEIEDKKCKKEADITAIIVLVGMVLGGAIVVLIGVFF